MSGGLIRLYPPSGSGGVALPPDCCAPQSLLDREPSSRHLGAVSTLRSIAELRRAGLVPAGREHELERVAGRYAVAITPDMLRLIDRGDPADPIARQLVPDADELQLLPEERADPLGEEQ